MSGRRGAVPSRLPGPFVFVSLVVAFALASAHGDHAEHAPADAPAPAAAVAAVVDPVLGELQGIVRWATYCGLVLVGALLFARLTAPGRRDNQRVRTMVVLGCAACSVTALVELLLFGPIATGRGSAALGDGALLATTLGTAHGRLLLAQAVSALLLAQVAARVLTATGPAYGRENVAIGLGLVLVTSVAANGHAGAQSAAALLPAVAHAAGMSLWFGSLLAAVVLPTRHAGGISSAEGRVLLSRVAAWCLYVVASSGLVLAWQLVPSAAALWSSGYGRTLVLKLALIAVLLTTAAVARSVVHHRPASNPPGGHRAAAVRDRIGSLRSVVVVELAIGVCVLAVTAHLVSQSPTAP